MSEVWSDDFLGGGSASGELGDAGWHATVTGAGSFGRIPSEQGHPGIIALVSGTTAGDRVAMHLGTTVTQGAFAVDDLRALRSTVRISAITNGRVRVGLGTSVSAASWGANGVYWEWDSAVGPNWRLVCRTASVNTTVDSGVAPVATEWQTLGLRRLQGGDWDGLVVTQAGVQTRTAAVAGAPASTVLVWGANVEALAAAARTLSVDVMAARYARAEALAAYL